MAPSRPTGSSWGSVVRRCAIPVPKLSYDTNLRSKWRSTAEAVPKCCNIFTGCEPTAVGPAEAGTSRRLVKRRLAMPRGAGFYGLSGCGGLNDREDGFAQQPDL